MTFSRRSCEVKNPIAKRVLSVNVRKETKRSRWKGQRRRKNANLLENPTVGADTKKNPTRDHDHEAGMIVDKELAAVAKTG